VLGVTALGSSGKDAQEMAWIRQCNRSIGLKASAARTSQMEGSEEGRAAAETNCGCAVNPEPYTLDS